MATLTIRNLSDAARDGLRVTAAKAGRSMEAEARSALESRYAPEPAPASPEERLARIDAAVTAAFAGRRPSGSVDAFLADRREEDAGWWAERGR